MYRGSAIPALHGRYVFGDFGTGNLWQHRARYHADADADRGAGAATGLQISSFGQDTDGEMYIVHLGGTLHRLVQGAGGGPPDSRAAFADRLRERQRPRRSRPAASFPTRPTRRSSPTARPRRAGWRCPTASASSSTRNNDFDFPNGSVLVKNFSLGATLVETRLFMRHSDGNWAGYTYEWNARRHRRHARGRRQDRAGRRPDLGIPERSAMPAMPHGRGRPHAGSRDRTVEWRLRLSATGRTANQLTTLNAIDTLTPALTLPPAQLPVIPDPFGTAPLGARARAYLHTNCANCHRPGGPAPSDLDFRYTTALTRDQCLRHHAHARQSRHHQSRASSRRVRRRVRWWWRA